MLTPSSKKSEACPEGVLQKRSEAEYNTEIIRFITCGSVDDGKSTLIGRLLFDGNHILSDQLEELAKESEKIGTQSGLLDFSLLVDGLSAEREQGITIDVAYRFFSWRGRRYIVADTPGHEQYTRNTVTAASTADAAVLIVDAKKGLLTQTKRHSFLCNILGVKHIILAINKMDLVDFRHDVFETIVSEYDDFAKSIGLKNFYPVPICALTGENVVINSQKCHWYNGKTLMEHLESVTIEKPDDRNDSFSMPVQWVNRPSADFRGFAGKILNGQINAGEQVRLLPSGQKTTVDRIVTYSGDLQRAVAGQSVTLTFKTDIDCSRGQIICSSDTPLESADKFQVHMVWMGDKPLVLGRAYVMHIGTDSLSCVPSKLKYALNVNTAEKLYSQTLSMNQVGVMEIHLDREIGFLPYVESRDLGGFILIDKTTNETVAAGLIDFALRRSKNIHWHAQDIDQSARSSIKDQKPALIWFTGLSGAGKSTIANAVEKRLFESGRHTFLLDGDNVRHGLNKDLGFTEVERIENIRRIGEVSKLMTEAGLIVMAAFISPFKEDREVVRSIIGDGNFIEVYVYAPLEVAEQRDTKGLYKKARRGELKNFTGLDSKYEAPENPEIIIDTTKLTVDEAANLIVKLVLEKFGTFGTEG